MTLGSKDYLIFEKKKNDLYLQRCCLWNTWKLFSPSSQYFIYYNYNEINYILYFLGLSTKQNVKFIIYIINTRIKWHFVKYDLITDETIIFEKKTLKIII